MNEGRTGAGAGGEQGGVFGNLPESRPGTRSPRRAAGRATKPKPAPRSPAKSPPKPAAAPRPRPAARPAPAPSAQRPKTADPASSTGGPAGLEDIAWAGVAAAAEAATIGVRLASRAIEALRGSTEKD